MKRVLVVLTLLSVGWVFGQVPIWHGCALGPNGREAWVATIETPSVYQTFDRGAVWTEQPILTNHDFFDIFFLDSLDGWTCGTIAEVWHTTDGGVTWNWQGFGASKFFTRIQFLDLTHGWAAAGAAIMGRWDEANQTWNQIILPYPQFSADTTDFYGLSFTDTLNGWICAGRYPVGDTYIGGQGYIGRTTDGGNNWTLQLRDTVYDLFDIHFLDTLNGWVVGGNDRDMSAHIARTTDGGATWNDVMTAPGGMLRAVHFSDAEHGWAVGKFGTILHTTDGGNQWLPQTSGVDSTLFDVDFSDSLNGVASGYDAVIFTSDGGATWDRTTVGIEEPKRENGRTRRDDGRTPSLVVAPSTLVASRSVVIAFELPALANNVTMDILDCQGRIVKPLLRSCRKNKGRFAMTWDGCDARNRPVASGVYVLSLSADQTRQTKKILCLRE